jgi:hypothetical protein
MIEPFPRYIGSPTNEFYAFNMTMSSKHLVVSGYFTGDDTLGNVGYYYPFFAIYELEPVIKFSSAHFLS